MPNDDTQSSTAFPTEPRKVLRIGHSFAITLPANWCRDVLGPNPRAIMLTRRTNGTLTVAPLSFARTPPEHKDRPD